MKVTRVQQFQRIVDDHYQVESIKAFPFVAVKDVVKEFDLGDYIIRAVDHINLSIAEYEYIVIIGTSGAGKTTLLHLLGGLDKPNSGQVILSFIDISPMEEETLATFRIFNSGFIFQTYNLISSLSAIENVMFPLQLCGTELNIAEKRAKELLKKVGLADREDHLPFQLSAGEQQRVAIARALANDPPIIIADEPTANLDKKNAEFIAQMFEALRQEGKTVIVATHDEKLIKHAHRIIEMEDGKIISDKRVQDVTYKPLTESAEQSFYRRTYFTQKSPEELKKENSESDLDSEEDSEEDTEDDLEDKSADKPEDKPEVTHHVP